MPTAKRKATRSTWTSLPPSISEASTQNDTVERAPRRAWKSRPLASWALILVVLVIFSFAISAAAEWLTRSGGSPALHTACPVPVYYVRLAEQTQNQLLFFDLSVYAST